MHDSPLEGIGFEPLVPLLRKVSRLLPTRDAGPISWMGSLSSSSSRETTMVGRGASLDGRLFLGGTDGSNPVPSSGESHEICCCGRARTVASRVVSLAFRFKGIEPALDFSGAEVAGATVPEQCHTQIAGHSAQTAAA